MSQYTIQFPFSSSSINSVTATTGSVSILSADSNRGKYILCHSGSAVAYVLLNGDTATTSALGYSFMLTNGQTYEDKEYKGAVSVIFSSASVNTVLNVTSIYK